MISLKKSFELQNYLRGLFNEGTSILRRNDFITTTTQKHHRDDARADAKYEEIVLPKQTEYVFTPTELISFIEYVCAHIANLTTAINRAKGEKYDTLIANNNIKRRMLSYLLSMAQVKPSSRITKGRSNCFNNDGNQIEYVYDMEEVTTIDFDRNVVKAIITKLRRELDESSQEIDSMALNTMVDYENVFEIGEGLEDAFTRWHEQTAENAGS